MRTIKSNQIFVSKIFAKIRSMQIQILLIQVDSNFYWYKISKPRCTLLSIFIQLSDNSISSVGSVFQIKIIKNILSNFKIHKFLYFRNFVLCKNSKNWVWHDWGDVPIQISRNMWPYFDLVKFLKTNEFQVLGYFSKLDFHY